jgi:hypothetical protein
MMTVVAIHYRGSFKISAPYSDNADPQRIAASLAYWSGRGQNTLPEHWICEARYTVNREHPQGKNLKYDTLLFYRHVTEPNVENPFKIHNSEWICAVSEE